MLTAAAAVGGVVGIAVGVAVGIGVGGIESKVSLTLACTVASMSGVCTAVGVDLLEQARTLINITVTKRILSLYKFLLNIILIFY